jgi:hypothetical protein
VVDIGADRNRSEVTREAESFYGKITEVREALRRVEHGVGSAAFGGVDDR